MNFNKNFGALAGAALAQGAKAGYLIYLIPSPALSSSALATHSAAKARGGGK